MEYRGCGRRPTCTSAEFTGISNVRVGGLVPTPLQDLLQSMIAGDVATQMSVYVVGLGTADGGQARRPSGGMAAINPWKARVGRRQAGGGLLHARRAGYDTDEVRVEDLTLSSSCPQG